MRSRLPRPPVWIVERAEVTSAPVSPGLFWKTYQVFWVPASRVWSFCVSS